MIHIYLIWDGSKVGLDQLASQYWFKDKNSALIFAAKINLIYPDKPPVTVQPYLVDEKDLAFNFWALNNPDGLQIVPDIVPRQVYAAASLSVFGMGEAAAIKKAIKNFRDDLRKKGKPLYPR